MHRYIYCLCAYRVSCMVQICGDTKFPKVLLFFMRWKREVKKRKQFLNTLGHCRQMPRVTGCMVAPESILSNSGAPPLWGDPTLGVKEVTQVRQMKVSRDVVSHRTQRGNKQCDSCQGNTCWGHHARWLLARDLWSGRAPVREDLVQPIELMWSDKANMWNKWMTL